MGVQRFSYNTMKVPPWAILHVCPVHEWVSSGTSRLMYCEGMATSAPCQPHNHTLDEQLRKQMGDFNVQGKKLQKSYLSGKGAK